MEKMFRAPDNCKNIIDCQPYRNIFEYDYTLWQLLSCLAKSAPDVAKQEYSLEIRTINKLANATPEQLLRISSGVALSFRLLTSEEVVIETLRQEYDPAIMFRQQTNELESAYWLNLNRLALQDTDIALIVYGVSPRLAHVVAEASDSQLRQLASKTQTKIGLRFTCSVIDDLLDDRRDVLLYGLQKKVQQILSHRGAK
ncbi:MAG: hypothetical protein ACRCUH_00360 [Shewanella sp.]